MNRPGLASSALLGGFVLPLVLTANPAHAAGNGSITATIGGVPSRVSAGGSFEVSVTSRSSSDDSILVDYLSLVLWQRNGGSTAGLSVQWQDPGTGQWVDAQPTGAGGWGLGGRRGLATVAPHGTLVTHARVLMGSAAPGSYTISSAGINGYELLGPSGDPISGHLDSIGTAQASFTYGSGSGAAPQSTATARPTTPTKAASPRSTTVPDAPAAEAPATDTPSAVTPSGTPVQATTPAPTQSADDSAVPAAPVTPTGAPQPTATAGRSGSAVAPVALGATALAAGAVAAAAVFRRRRALAQAEPTDT
ncbi:hypothetical protein [Kitasatospora terrestris]|uniref:Gram-positive cocci surface proteins LPxTG domain-containing protein n=1 Tax=Kitasatospora terrestris TaxID=258051 RepID=A0ABP9D9A5_9ACTN